MGLEPTWFSPPASETGPYYQISARRYIVLPVGFEPTRPFERHALNMMRTTYFATGGFVLLYVLQAGSVFTSHSLIFDRFVWSPVLESNQLLQFCRLIPRRRAYRACWMVFSTIMLCCVGGFEPSPGGAASSTVETYYTHPATIRATFTASAGVPTPGLLAGSTSKKPSMRRPVEDRTPIPSLRILFPNQLEDRTL